MADKVTNKKNALLDNSVVENLIDRQLINLLNELPDPDIILRKAGIDHLVYDEIMADPHVLGEIRTMRSGLLSFKHELKPGDETTAAANALALCQDVMQQKPHVTMKWPDLMWSIGKAPLVGRRVHHVQWQQVKGYLVPDQIFNIDPLSFAFSESGELLIKTTTRAEGEPAEDYRWLVTRHMPDSQNPYGVAILSTCFWPWMFKNGGLKFFVKFCEKFGIPWPVGKYPQGTSEKDIDELVERLENMVEDAVAAVPEGVELDILSTSSTGDLPQERLVNLMNREMSKAITSQSLATEQNYSGSRAASETHLKRNEVNQKTDRMLVADTLNELFAWITHVNFGDSVAPPYFTYVDKKDLSQTDVQFFSDASKLVPIKKSDIYKRLELTEPSDADEVIFQRGKDANQSMQNITNEPEFALFAKEQESQTFDKEDIAIEQMVEQVKQAIDKGESFEDALQTIVSMMSEIDTEALQELLRNELELQFGLGMIESQGEIQ